MNGNRHRNIFTITITSIRLHAPHNPPVVRRYAIEAVIAPLKAEGLIE